MELSLQVYKEKHQDYMKVNEKKMELEKYMISLTKRSENLENQEKILQHKLEKYKEMIQSEVIKVENFEKELNLKTNEIFELKESISDLDNLVSRKEQKINKLNSKIDLLVKEDDEDDSNNYNENVSDSKFSPRVTIQNEFDEAIKNLENQYNSKILNFDEES